MDGRDIWTGGGGARKWLVGEREVNVGGGMAGLRDDDLGPRRDLGDAPSRGSLRIGGACTPCGL